MKKLSALLLSLLVSSAVFAQQAGTFQIGNTTVQGVATPGPNGTTIVTSGNQTMTLTPTSTPGTFTVTQSTIPGVTAGAGTTVSVTSGAIVGAGAGAVATGGAVFAGAAFAAVVSVAGQNKGTTGTTSGTN